MRHASKLIFTAESARRMYMDRYADLPAERCVVISNGYDEADFEGLELDARNGRNCNRFRLLHLGLLYPEERDPRPFFQAISRLKAEGKLSPESISIEMRACGFENLYAPMLRDLQIQDIVALLPPLPYRDALQEAASADALLLMQAASCDHQIPAKVYEYLRLGKPILALISPTGDTATLLRATGGATLANIADQNGICQALPLFIETVRTATHPRGDPRALARYERSALTVELARQMNEILSEPQRPADRHSRT